MSKKGRILVAMSGGVDSSVAALLLHEQGYEVIGITMKTWDYASSGGVKKETGCCSLDSINDARSMAVKFGFPHYILDLRGEFGDSIINNFVDEYLAGRTPNPCILCNTHIKWEALLKRADQLECEYIATGHYAKVRYEEKHDPSSGSGRYIVSKGVDENKDQSYVLWGLTQESIKRTIFPLGEYRKPEVRKVALDSGFKNLAQKKESYEICFIPDNDYRAFLKNRVQGLEEKVNDGKFVLADGTEVGSHKGYPFYTIGQRKGLEIALGEPMFVKEVIPGKNVVVLGRKEELQNDSMTVVRYNLIKYSKLPFPMEAHAKIRYKDAGAPATITECGDKIQVDFHRKVSAITPGQSAVFYEGDDIIGGGFIERGTTVKNENNA